MRRDLIREIGGGSSGARRKRKYVEIGERLAAHEIHRRAMIVFGFAGKAGDHVGADGGVRQPR